MSSLGAARTPDPMTPVPVRIREVRRETADTFTWVIDREQLPAGYGFRPGQFNMVYAFGAGEVPLSISGDPAGPDLVHTIRAVGSVTRVMQGLTSGATIGLRGPFGSAWPVPECAGRDVVVVAGGIGLAPLRPAILELLAARGRFRRITVLYGARTDRDLLYPEQLQQWRGRFDLDVEVTVDQGSAAWMGSVGVVTRLFDGARFEPAETVAMLCGPEVMMRFCVRELEARGVPLGRIFLSMERNMKCAVGTCGHCQYGADFVCKDGPVFPFGAIERRFFTREV